MFTFGGVLKRKTFRSWKKHMDEKHGGATPEELETVNAIISSGSRATKTQEQLELEASPEAQGEPQLDSEGNPLPAPATTQGGGPERKKRLTSEQRVLNKEINEKAAAMMKFIFEGVPRMMFNAMAASQQSDTFRLSDGEEKMFSEAMDLASKGMGVNWEIEPWNITVANPLWLLILPIGVFIWIFIGKKRAVDAERATMEPPAQPEQVQ
jgi:hypothetical protein